MRIKIFHNNKPHFQHDYFEDVKTIWIEKQPKNGKWLFILFKPGSKNFKEFTHGQCAIEIDRYTEFLIEEGDIK